MYTKSSKNTVHWYDIEMLLDVVIFIIPPIGFYGIYKSKINKNKTMKWWICIGAFFLSISMALSIL